jgi:acid stress-induced BolA-like protein IbaG/YrbA
MDAQTLESLIVNALPGAQVRVEDVRGDGALYSAYIADRAFEGKTRIEQHRMVHAALKGQIGDVIHSLSLQTAIPKG